MTYDLAWTQAGDTDCDILRTRSHNSGSDPVYDMGGGLEHLAAGIKDIEHAGATYSTGTEHSLSIPASLSHL